MKNVLQLVGSFHMGGSERQAVQLTRLLHENKTYNIFLAALNKEGVLREEVEQIGRLMISVSSRINQFRFAAGGKINRQSIGVRVSAV